MPRNDYEDFCTAAWAATLIYGHVKELSDSDLKSVKMFIDDETNRRSKEKSDDTL